MTTDEFPSMNGKKTGVMGKIWQEIDKVPNFTNFTASPNIINKQNSKKGPSVQITYEQQIMWGINNPNDINFKMVLTQHILILPPYLCAAWRI